MLQQHIEIFLLVLTRVSGIFILSPFFGSLNIPRYIRVGAAFFISIVLFPIVDINGISVPTSLGYYALAVIGELLVGIMIGFAATVVLATIKLAGQLMDMQVGFAMVNVVDPTSEQQVTLIGSFLYNLCILVFLLTNGHYLLLTALTQSFATVPLLTAQFKGALTLLMVKAVGNIFLIGLKIALPVLFAILLTNIGLGVLARTMPQMNIFVVGIPAQIVVGIFILGMMLPFYGAYLGVIFHDMAQTIKTLLQVLQL